MPRPEWRIPITNTSDEVLLVRGRDASISERLHALSPAVATHAVARWFPDSDPFSRTRLIEIYLGLDPPDFDPSRVSTAFLRDRIAYALSRGTLLAVPTARPRAMPSVPSTPPLTRHHEMVGEERKEITAVRIISLTFNTEHHLLTDYETDWKTGGQKYVDKDDGKHWTPAHNFPISHTMDQIVTVTAEFEVSPGDASPTSIDFKGDGSMPPLTFSGYGSWSGRQPVRMSARGPEALEKRVEKMTASISWQAKADGKDFDAGSTGAHTIYVTLGTPIDEGRQEDGVTLRRMDKAVEMVSATGSIDPHTIVSKLLRTLGSYTLRPSPRVPPQYSHPNYFNDEGGAWALGDYISERAECQAMVRFVRGVLHQVGSPGRAEAVVIWADPDVENGTRALEADWDSGGGGLSGKIKVVGHDTWYAALLDSPAEEGRVYTIHEVGFNNFEACLKFTHNGVTRYYGGGLRGSYVDSAQDVIRAFVSLAWVSPRYDASGEVAYRIERIVARY